MSTYTYYFLDGIDRYIYNINGEQVIDMDDIPISSTICNVPEEYYVKSGKNRMGILGELDKESYNIAQGRERRTTHLRLISFEDLDEEPTKEDKYSWEDDLSDELNEFMSSLTEYQRNVLWLKADGYSISQIAKMYGVKRPTIVYLLERIGNKAMKGSIYDYFVRTHNIYE